MKKVIMVAVLLISAAYFLVSGNMQDLGSKQHPLAQSLPGTEQSSDTQRKPGAEVSSRPYSHVRADEDQYTEVRDLTVYLDMNVVRAFEDATKEELLQAIDNGSAEAAYMLAWHYPSDPDRATEYMLMAAGMSQKTGPLEMAVNMCCPYQLGDEASEVKAEIRRKAIEIILKETKHPAFAYMNEFESWGVAPIEIAAEVEQERLLLIEQINAASRRVNGEDWL